jgi:hypothetical protein
MRLRWHHGYALAALAVFLIEVAIALWVRDAIIRPYGGDVLAVILVYLGIRAVSDVPVLPAAILAFAVGCTVEAAQAAHLLHLIGWADNAIASTVMGTSFSWGDIGCYAAGAIFAILAESRARLAIWRDSV